MSAFSLIAGQVNSADVTKPAISFNSMTWDFGSVPADFRIAHSFGFKNSGDADLRITKIYPNCDCTTAAAKDTIIHPGDSSRIKVIFHTREFYGITTKKLYVYTNDPGNEMIELEYTANVEFFHKLHTSDPKYMIFLQGQDSKELRLINQSEDKVAYAVEEEPGSFLSFDRMEGSLSAKTIDSIAVKVRDGISNGTYFTNFTVIYDTNPVLRLTIPVKIVRW